MPKPTLRKGQKFRSQGYKPLNVERLMRRLSRLQKAQTLRVQRQRKRKK